MQNVVCSRVGAPFIIFLNTHCYDMTTTAKSDLIIIFNLEKKKLAQVSSLNANIYNTADCRVT